MANINTKTHPTGVTTMTASEAIPAHTLVTNDSGKVKVCGATDRPIGVSVDSAGDDGEAISVALLGVANGTVTMTASAAIDVHVPVYVSSAGKVSETATTDHYFTGMALESATTNGDLVEVAHAIARVAQSA